MRVLFGDLYGDTDSSYAITPSMATSFSLCYLTAYEQAPQYMPLFVGTTCTASTLTMDGFFPDMYSEEEWHGNEGQDEAHADAGSSMLFHLQVAARTVELEDEGIITCMPDWTSVLTTFGIETGLSVETYAGSGVTIPSTFGIVAGAMQDTFSTPWSARRLMIALMSSLGWNIMTPVVSMNTAAIPSAS